MPFPCAPWGEAIVAAVFAVVVVAAAVAAAVHFLQNAPDVFLVLWLSYYSLAHSSCMYETLLICLAVGCDGARLSARSNCRTGRPTTQLKVG